MRFMRFPAGKRARAKNQGVGEGRGGERAPPPVPLPLVRCPVSPRRVSRRPPVKVRPDFSPLEDPRPAGSFARASAFRAHKGTQRR